MKRMVRIVMVVALSSAGLVACDDVAPPPPVDNTVVLSVRYGGGYGASASGPGSGPLAVVYGDGRVVWENQVRTEIYPQPAWPTFSQMRISSDGVAEVRRRATAADLTTARRWEGVRQCVTDLGATVFVFEGQRSTAVGVGIGSPCPGMSAAEIEALTQLATLQTWISNAATNLAPYVVEQQRAMPFDRIAMHVTDLTAQSGAAPSTPRTRQWPNELAPLGSLPRDEIQPGDWCEIRAGVDLIPAWLLAVQTTSDVVFLQAGTRYVVQFRPMVGGETACVSWRN